MASTPSTSAYLPTGLRCIFLFHKSTWLIGSETIVQMGNMINRALLGLFSYVFILPRNSQSYHQKVHQYRDIETEKHEKKQNNL